MRWAHKPRPDPREWHSYFRFWPLCKDGQCVALERIERRLRKFMWAPHGPYPIYEYRIPPMRREQ